MKIRRAVPSDFPEIAAIRAASWKDAHADVMPAAFLAGQVDRDLAKQKKPPYSSSHGKRARGWPKRRGQCEGQVAG
jgi:hypothetical protein